jgi:hypothetical protein
MIAVIITASGQDTKPSQSYPWSISLSYAPKFGSNLFGSYALYPYDSYLFSFDLRAEHRFTEKFSYSFGIDFNRNHENISQLTFDASSEVSKSSSYLIELPLQINYYIISNPKNIDPYISMSLRNSYLHYYKKGTLGGAPINIKNSDYFLFYDFGIGSNFRLNKTISITFESSFAYGLIHENFKFNYFETSLGIKYSLQK